MPLYLPKSWCDWEIMSSSAYINGSLDYPLQKYKAYRCPGHEGKWFYNIETYHGYNKIKPPCESERTVLSRHRSSTLMSVDTYLLLSVIKPVNLESVFPTLCPTHGTCMVLMLRQPCRLRPSLDVESLIFSPPPWRLSLSSISRYDSTNGKNRTMILIVQKRIRMEVLLIRPSEWALQAEANTVTILTLAPETIESDEGQLKHKIPFTA